MKTSWLIVLLMPSAVLAAEPSYYWSTAKVVPPKGATYSILVLGKRTEDREKKRVLDEQTYLSGDQGLGRYTYVFHMNGSNKMEVTSRGKTVGEGKFQCEGDDWKWKSCTYEYQIKGKRPYSAKGSDTFEGDYVLYREKAEVTYPNEANPEQFSADYVSISKQTYDVLNRRLK